MKVIQRAGAWLVAQELRCAFPVDLGPGKEKEQEMAQAEEL